MAYARYIPAPPLDRFVGCFWYWEGMPEVAAKERLMPTGEPSIILNLRDDPLSLYASPEESSRETYGLALFSGAHTQPLIIDNQRQDRVFGIQFAPGGAYPFLLFPADELANRSVPLELLWKGTVNRLREQLLAAPSIRAMFQAAERVMLAQAVRPIELHPAVRFSVRGLRAATSVSKITDQTGLSQRHFIELFSTQVGLTPKAYSRVQRFQNVLQRVHCAAQVDWSQVALEHGYFDQAHFIHDFKDFSGFTPTSYWQRRIEHLNHVPIDV